jgi:rubrerythrin
MEKNERLGRDEERESLARRNGWVCTQCGHPFAREDVGQTLCAACMYKLYYD